MHNFGTLKEVSAVFLIHLCEYDREIEEMLLCGMLYGRIIW